MARPINLDMEVLRTFATGFELGSFVRAAERLGRSPSAVSTQLRKLEEQVGQPLVRKSGRGLAPTTTGETLLGYAKQLLDLNDEAIRTIRGDDVEGWVRLGLAQDFAETWLPTVLTRFARSHGKVRIEVQVDRVVALAEKTAKGELDLALLWGDGSDAPHAERIADIPIRWIGGPGRSGAARFGDEPIPFAAFQPPCVFRAAAIAALDAQALPWRLVFTSPSLAGLWAAAESGLGITARTILSVPKSLHVLDPAKTGLPLLPSVPLALHCAEPELSSAGERLKEILLETIRAQIGSA